MCIRDRQSTWGQVLDCNAKECSVKVVMTNTPQEATFYGLVQVIDNKSGEIIAVSSIVTSGVDHTLRNILIVLSIILVVSGLFGYNYYRTRRRLEADKATNSMNYEEATAIVKDSNKSDENEFVL
eukprot:TRINITY_DN8941_c0_g1_i1.p1 TRINITY_DN8941_c0_g1~~TRINITY_DN8941_c0_g1_i1.p1  ORF type:complete len:144 (+),score=47.25 TRINITY_DN8941_c0_g1_i1:60-434(+)